jgi:hypothetical protein
VQISQIKFFIMRVSSQLAKHFHEVYFGGNWTSVNLKDTLADISWQQATRQVQHFNTIAALVFHCNYYVSAVLNVLKGSPLQASDTFSFDVPEIQFQETWDALLNKTFSEATAMAACIEQLPDDKLWEAFADEKYGNYFRNLQGIIEHTHYHLGQMVILKKILQQDDSMQ